MKAPIIEIFSSFQGEGLLIGERQTDEINKLLTPDCRSISFTGGEPSLYPDFINEVSKLTDLKIMLETNGTLPDNIDSIEKLDMVSLDIKLPEHFDGDFDDEIFFNEIKSLNLLMAKSKNVYCKVVILPSTKIKSFKEVIKKLSDNISSKSDLQIIIQPSSPLNEWKDLNFKLFEFSEIVGQYFEVSTIPQIHKILDIE